MVEEGAIFDGVQYDFWHSCSISLPPPKFSVRPEQSHLSALLLSSINATSRTRFVRKHSPGPLEISTWAGGCHETIPFVKPERKRSRKMNTPNSQPLFKRRRDVFTPLDIERARELGIAWADYIDDPPDRRTLLKKSKARTKGIF